MKRSVIFLLIAAMVMLTFSGCGPTPAEKMEELSGVWVMTVDDTEEEARGLLDYIEAYDEEIALADLTSLDYVKQVEFTTMKTYSFGYGIEGTKACVKAFYEAYFDALYEGRSTLNAVYGETFDQMTKEEFQSYYATMYSCASYAEMVEQMAENAYDYTAMEQAWETGTYTIKGSDIMTTITGETTAEALGYSISDNTLTLTYVNAIEVYTKEN